MNGYLGKIINKKYFILEKIFPLNLSNRLAKIQIKDYLVF